MVECGCIKSDENMTIDLFKPRYYPRSPVHLGFVVKCSIGLHKIYSGINGLGFRV